MKRLIYLFALTVLFVGSMTAQSFDLATMSSSELSSFDMVGAQSAEGVCDQTSETCVGNTFVLNGANEKFSVNMTISMDYSTADPNPGSPSQITQGTWTLTVYKDGAYYGTIYGEILGGSISWQTDESQAIVSRESQVKLKTVGGLDGFGEGYELQPAENFLTAFTSFSSGGQSMTTGKLDITF